MYTKNQKILFFGSNLLYFRSLIPIICNLNNKNCEIYIYTNSLDIFSKFLFKFIKKKYPTKVNIVTLFTLEWISKLINYELKFKKIKNKIKFHNKFSLRKKHFDKLVCTTKDLNEINLYNNFSFRESYALGYQHLPVFIDLNKKGKQIPLNNKLKDFEKIHSFKKILRNYDFQICKFTWLNKIKFKRNKNSNKVIIFHPGGYRNVLTSLNENKKNSIIAQENFIKKICLPLLKYNYKPIIKIHPLYAQYHGENECRLILKKLGLLNKVEIIGPDNSYYKFLNDVKFAITLGSSSSYELWSIGFKNILYCNMFGSSRVKKFNLFKKEIFSNEMEFIKIIKSKNIYKFFSKQNINLMNFFKETKNLNNFIVKKILS